MDTIPFERDRYMVPQVTVIVESCICMKMGYLCSLQKRWRAS